MNYIFRRNRDSSFLKRIVSNFSNSYISKEGIKINTDVDGDVEGSLFVGSEKTFKWQINRYIKK